MQGLKYFEKHLSSEFSVENVSFWKACRDYRHLASRLLERKAADVNLQLQLKANEIMGLYITEESVTQVNIPAPTRKNVIAAVKVGKLDADTFLAAETEIINLVRRACVLCCVHAWYLSTLLRRISFMRVFVLA